MSTNSITGDKLVSKPSTTYGAGWELIWRKDKELEQDIRITRLSGEAREQHNPPNSSREVHSREET